jgi:hypothetical protein
VREINGAVRDDTLSSEPLSDLQRSLLENTAAVTGGSAGAIATEGAAALHVRAMMQLVTLGQVAKDTPPPAGAPAA